MKINKVLFEIFLFYSAIDSTNDKNVGDTVFHRVQDRNAILFLYQTTSWLIIIFLHVISFEMVTADGPVALLTVGLALGTVVGEGTDFPLIPFHNEVMTLVVIPQMHITSPVQPSSSRFSPPSRLPE